MKVNFFMLIISLIIGGLVFYGFYSMETAPLFSILGGVLCTLMLVTGMSLTLPTYPRSSVMFKTLAYILFFGLLVIDFIFIKTGISRAVFVITNGLIAAIGAIGLHFIYKSGQ